VGIDKNHKKFLGRGKIIELLAQGVPILSEGRKGWTRVP
jgi:hypothetical protein